MNHPLDKARAFLAMANHGDVITLRDYGAQHDPPALKARVVRYSQHFMWVELDGHERKIRLDPARKPSGEVYCGGTLVDNPAIGVDTSVPIEHKACEREHPERAVPMLRKVREGDLVPVIGYPPFDGERRSLPVVGVSPLYISLRLGRRKVRMFRRGVYAGIIEGEFFVLDTTGGPK